jgi:hypothetical protein
MKNTSLILLLVCPFLTFAQQQFFSPISETDITAEKSDRLVFPSSYATLSLDKNQFDDFVKSSSKKGEGPAQIIALPMPDGSFQQFEVYETPLLAPHVAEGLPEHRDFSGWGLEDPLAYLRMGWTSLGFHAMIIKQGETIFIDPYTSKTKDYYMSYTKEAYEDSYLQEFESFKCYYENPKGNTVDPNYLENAAQLKASGDQLRTYRIAVAATEDYYSAIGGTQADAFSAIQTTIARVAGIFEIDFAITFSIVSSQSEVYTTNNVPYTTEGSGSLSTMLSDNQTNLDNVIGSGNYDIGHVFDSSGGSSASGLAALNAVCNNSTKARGASRGFANPTGDSFDVNLVAHEFGHQFGANHTFNSITDACNGNRNASTAYEPGSGTTIMSYTACGVDNIQSSNDSYFHVVSYEEIMTYITGGGVSGCPTITATGNSVPVVNANPSGMSYTIPISTPFELEGSATDADGDNLTYCWEEYDLGAAGSPSASSAPYFRSYPPTSSSTRLFPALSGILDGTNATTGENLPNGSTTLNFKLTVRDNNGSGGGSDNASTSVTVDAAAGPFEVTSQNSNTSLTANGVNTMTVTWNVANTDIGSVDCDFVDILFSTDGGETFPYTLASSTANDGTHTVTIPSYPTTNGRIKVVCSDNIFFDINNGVVSISSACIAKGASFSPSTSFSAAAGDASLDFSLSTDWGSQVSSISGTVTTSDTQARLGVEEDGMGTCRSIGNRPYNISYEFEVDASGSYTFSKVSGMANMVLTLYEFSYDPDNPCTNWIACSGDYDPSGPSVILSNSVSASLIPNKTYILVVSGFSTGDNGAYNVSFSGAGNIYDGPVNPGVLYAYSYVVVNTATGNIVAVQSDADLSNSGTFPAGSYRIYGLSYLNTETVATYSGSAYTTLQSDLGLLNLCGNLSDNYRDVAISALLPVEIARFDAHKKDDMVELTWQTEVEIDNDFFTLERSANGRDFEPLTRIEGQGNTITATTYEFRDEAPLSGTNYYRLSQTDFDGTNNFIGVRVVEFDSKDLIWDAYPNPLNDEVLNLSIKSPFDGEMNLEIHNATGQLIVAKSFELQAGAQDLNWSLETLPAGVYILNSYFNGLHQTQKLVKM